ncbi:MAG: transglutaminase-like domain-containing protein [Bacillota bacterium]|nr:transglutaminase-like domain-containing protein [Bacillota bacterium]
MYKQIISLLTTIFLSVTSIQIGLGNLNNGNAEQIKSQVISTAKISSNKAASNTAVNMDKPQQTSNKVVAASAVKTTAASVKAVSSKTAAPAKTAAAAINKTTAKTAAPLSKAAAKTVDSAPKTAAPASSNEALGTAGIDTSNSGRGVVGVKYTHSSGEKIKVIVNKSGSKYTYNLNSLTGFEYFPLQMGNGDYTVTIYKNISGTSYSTIKSYSLNVNLSDSSIVYLNSIQNIRWTSSTNAVVKARSLASGKGSAEAKVAAIYEYVVTNIKYDRSKVNTLSYSYVPSVSATFSTKQGICYDFASTFAAMLRGVSIPARLVMGNSVNANGYHAWNEVLINGSWVIIDTSYDSQLKQAGRSYSMIKSSSQYSKTKEY